MWPTWSVNISLDSLAACMNTHSMQPFPFHTTCDESHWLILAQIPIFGHGLDAFEHPKLSVAIGGNTDNTSRPKIINPRSCEIESGYLEIGEEMVGSEGLGEVMTLDDSSNVAYSKYTVGRRIRIIEDNNNPDHLPADSLFLLANGIHMYCTVRATVVYVYSTVHAVAPFSLGSRAFILPLLSILPRASIIQSVYFLSSPPKRTFFYQLYVRGYLFNINLISVKVSLSSEIRSLCRHSHLLFTVVF